MNALRSNEETEDESDSNGYDDIDDDEGSNAGVETDTNEESTNVIPQKSPKKKSPKRKT